MFRYLLITACLAVPVFSNSAGAPQAICSNGLTPEHHVDPQTSPVPYSFSAAEGVRAGEKLSITLGGDAGFLGYAVQVRDGKDQPIGQLHVVDSKISQTRSCGGPDDTLTHRLIPRENPLKRVEFQWSPPKGYKGKATIVATVAKDGGTYWIRKVLKDIQVA